MTTWLSFYFTAALFLSSSTLFYSLLYYLTLRNKISFSMVFLNKFGRWMVLSSFAVVAFNIFIELDPLTISSGNIHIAPSFEQEHRLIINELSYLPIKHNLLSLYVPIWLEAILSVGILFFITFYLLNIYSLIQIKRSSFLIKKIGRITLMGADEISVPFVFSLPFKSFIIIPIQIIEDWNQAAIAISHEMQHLRHKDTHWAHFFYLLKALFFWNPLIYKLFNTFSKVSEHAVDEVLVNEKKFSAHDYSQCLINVARLNLSQHRMSLLTIGMAHSTSHTFLQRRIERMNVKRLVATKNQKSLLLVAFGLALGVTAYAGNQIHLREELNLEKASYLLENSDRSNFPLEVNDTILAQLNRYIATNKGKRFLKDSLQRKKIYAPILMKKFKEYQIPAEIMAVPLIESGFNNKALSYMKARGIWQFIPSTARNYGMRVNDSADDRIDPEKATDGALRLLSALKLRFKDWRLAILAYNAGENMVQKGITKTNSRDPWTLIRKGYAGDKDYLAKVMAGAFILKNPSLL